MFEDQSNFFNKIDDFKPYKVEFKKDNKMKSKIYLFNYTVGGNNQQLIIVIINAEYIFSTNDNI